jgi:hypothetical protein
VGTRRSSASALGILLLLVAATATSRKASPAPAPGRGPAVPRGPAPAPRPRTLTGGGASWAAERKAALAQAGITGEVALSILAQWDFETGGGAAEWNFNVGNIKASGAQPRVDLGAAGMFRAFDTLDDGVRAYLTFIQSGRFTPCWGTLNADPQSDDWIRCLGRLQYFEGDVETYAAGWRGRRAKLQKLFAISPDEIHGDFFGFLNALRR